LQFCYAQKTPKTLIIKSMKVSILLPTRKRFDSLKKSLESLVSKNRGADIEPMLAVDDDDADLTDAARRAHR